LHAGIEVTSVVDQAAEVGAFAGAAVPAERKDMVF
jgi:hypothetical protein